jgi:cytidyltransferase-like protein
VLSLPLLGSHQADKHGISVHAFEAASEKLLLDFRLLSGKVGVFGGTFDPVHNGHIEVGRIVTREFGLDSLIFMPCPANPLKERKPSASPHERVDSERSPFRYYIPTRLRRFMRSKKQPTADGTFVSKSIE